MTDEDLPPILTTIKETPLSNIIADIIGHPKGMPSKRELDHMNPSLTSSTISEHLTTLTNKGIIGQEQVDRSGNGRDTPESFYYLTDEARELFDRNNIFDEAAYQAAYQEISKPNEIQTIEQIERPTPDSS